MPYPKRSYHKRGELVHGYWTREHPLYTTWHNMLKRCYIENDPAHHNYGGRGIKVCSRWHHFKNFAEDMGLKPSAELTLERVDNAKHYNKDNCVWTTRSNQCVNRRKFKSNSTGATGILKNKFKGYSARFDYEHERYEIGLFDTFEAAVTARKEFIKLFNSDRELAVKSISKETLWRNSSTKIRGVTLHKDGGYIVRMTVSGERVYLGYYKTLKEACDARDNYFKN